MDRLASSLPGGVLDRIMYARCSPDHLPNGHSREHMVSAQAEVLSLATSRGVNCEGPMYQQQRACLHISPRSSDPQF